MYFSIRSAVTLRPVFPCFASLAGLSGAGTLIKLSEAHFERFGKIPVYNNGILFPLRKHFSVSRSFRSRGDVA
jgi:hypothetical protein